MTPPPPALRGPTTGNRGKRPRAPVSDRPGDVLLIELVLPHDEGELMLVGIDWASEEHAVCVLDDDGRAVDRFSIAHSADGFDRLTTRLPGHGDPPDVPAASQRPDGGLLHRLADAG